MQLYYFSLGDYGTIQFVATEEIGEAIAERVNKEREAKKQSYLNVRKQKITPVESVESYFNEE